MDTVTPPVGGPVRSPGGVAAKRRRQAWNYVAVLALVSALAAGPILVTNSYYRYAGVLMVMYMVMATSWNLVGGFTGYVSLGHAAFFGFGAYCTGIIANDSRASVILALLATVGICLAVAAVIGVVALRVRGSSFVIVTIALVYMGSLLAQGLRSLTGGSRGLDVAGLYTFSTRAARHGAYIVTFAVLLGVVMFLWNFIDGTKFGMGLKAVREDEDRAQSLGVNTTAFKVVAFALSATFVGLAGGLYATWTGFIDPIFVFSVQISAQLVLMTLLGGMRSLWGPVLGAAIIVPSGEFFLVNLPEYHLVSMGVMLGTVVMLMPNGIIPTLRRLWDRRNPPAASIRELAGSVGALDSDDADVERPAGAPRAVRA
jgi:branched-chain amino acid transport system permease protein